MTTDRVLKEVKRFLTKEEPSVFCLSGPWGVGKTFAWKSILTEAVSDGSLDGKLYSYVSLFGIDELSSLRSALLENVEYLNKNPATRGFGKGAKRVLPAIKVATEALGLSDIANASSSLLFAAVRNQIICIDDLERRGEGLHIKDVFGLISFLRQERGCRVAILLNEEGSEERENYRKYYEKVVEKSVHYLPSPSQSCSIALTKGLSFEKELTRRCIQLGIVNVRIIRSIADFLSDVVPPLSRYHSGIIEQVIHSSVLFGWSLLRGEGAPTIEKIESISDYDLGGGEKRKQDSTEKKWDEILAAYEFTSLDAVDFLVLKSLKRGYFDIDEARPILAARSEEYVQIDKSEKLRSAWAQYRGSFDHDEGLVLGAMIEAVRDGAAYLPLSAVESVLSLLRDLGHVDDARALVTFVLAARPANASEFDIARHRGIDPISDPDLVAGMNERYVALSPPNSLLATLKELAARNSWNDDILARLAGASPDEYSSLFLTLRDSDLEDCVTASLQFRRISNATPQMIQISENASVALRQIAATSQLNAKRVARFGVT